MGPLQLSDHVVQNRQTGEQMTHWAMLNKENSDLVALLNMSQTCPMSLSSQHWKHFIHNHHLTVKTTTAVNSQSSAWHYEGWQRRGGDFVEKLCRRWHKMADQRLFFNLHRQPNNTTSFSFFFWKIGIWEQAIEQHECFLKCPCLSS